MIRKILAAIVSVITLVAIKETIVIFIATGTVDNYRKPLIVLALSITIPLILISLWLWRPKSKASDEGNSKNQL